MAVNPDSLLYPATGVLMSNEPSFVYPQKAAGGGDFVYMAVNMRISEQRWKTRHRWIELKCDERDVQAFEKWSVASTQGAIWYDPAARESFDPFAIGDAGIVESAAGRMYRLTPSDYTFRCEQIEGPEGRPTMRIAWLAQGDRYVVRTDRASLTQIYDGQSISTSTGFNRNDPETSQLPNFAGPLCFTDRYWITNGNREIIAGDHLHAVDLIGPTDLLTTRDQSYDINDVSFSPPASFGDVVGLYLFNSSRGGTLSSQSEIIAGCCDPAMWGVQGGIPREQWRTSQMRREIHPDTAPTGPYASARARNEILFRSINGFETMKYFDDQFARVGNPTINLGQEIKLLLDYDYPDFLFFNSTALFRQRQRVVSTVDPQVKYTDRWHSAFVSANLNHTSTRVPNGFVWEGLQTLPSRMGQPVQFVEGNGGRVFCILRKSDGAKGLAEWTTQTGPDVLADGTAIPQRWRIITRRLTIAGEFRDGGFSHIWLFLSGSGNVTVNIQARTDDGELQDVGCYAQTECCFPWVLSTPLRFELPAKGKTVQFIFDGTGTIDKIDFAVDAVQSGTAAQDVLVCREIPTNQLFVYA